MLRGFDFLAHAPDRIETGVAARVAGRGPRPASRCSPSRLRAGLRGTHPGTRKPCGAASPSTGRGFGAGPGEAFGPITISATMPIRKELAPADVEHRPSTPGTGGTARPGRPAPLRAASRAVPDVRSNDLARIRRSRGTSRGPASRPECRWLPAEPDGRWSLSVRPSGLLGRLSSSDRPFLNDLMPLAKSPIISEILPRPPNNSSKTAPTMIQCQMLIEPMRNSSANGGPHGPCGRLAREDAPRN